MSEAEVAIFENLRPPRPSLSTSFSLLLALSPLSLSRGTDTRVPSEPRHCVSNLESNQLRCPVIKSTLSSCLLSSSSCFFCF